MYNIQIKFIASFILALSSAHVVFAQYHWSQIKRVLKSDGKTKIVYKVEEIKEIRSPGKDSVYVTYFYGVPDFRIVKNVELKGEVIVRGRNKSYGALGDYLFDLP